MPKRLLPITTLFLILFALAALLACNGATPTPNPTKTPVPTSIAAATPLIANTPRPEGTSTRNSAPPEQTTMNKSVITIGEAANIRNRDTGTGDPRDNPARKTLPLIPGGDRGRNSQALRTRGAQIQARKLQAESCHSRGREPSAPGTDSRTREPRGDPGAPEPDSRTRASNQGRRPPKAPPE